MLLALLLGLTAAAANILGGLFILHRDWSRQFLKYFLALGAGFMLAAAILEILPESVAMTGSLAYFLVLVGYFIVHFFEHTLAPHFHFGEETHVEHFVPEHAGISALLGLSIHTFFDGVAIASGFLVSGWLGGVIFLAIVLHKIPEGFTVASLMLASGQSRRTGFLAAIWLGVATVAGILPDGLAAFAGRLCAAVFGGRHALCRCLRSNPRSESRARHAHGVTRFPGRLADVVARPSVSHLVARAFAGDLLTLLGLTPRRLKPVLRKPCIEFCAGWRYVLGQA